MPDQPKPSWSEQKQYDFDVWYCSEPTAMLQVLGWVNVICIIILMFLFTITGTLRDTSGFEFWAEMTWLSWGQLFDGVGGSPDGYLWGTRAVGLVVTFMGMFVFGLVCAWIEDVINSKLDSLRRGRSRVLEKNFNFIIGWNPRILPLVQQLILAAESDGGGTIVILSEMDKPEMDDFWANEIPLEERMGTKIVTRQGQPIEAFNLEKCSASKAKSVVVLSPDPFNSDESDAAVTRIMLALTGKIGTPGTGGSSLNGHVVVELCDIDNQSYVYLGINDRDASGNVIRTKDEVAQIKETYIKPIVSHDVTGRLMIQCALEPGLARVFTHIFAFSDNEFYFQNFPELARRRFADVCFMFEDAVPFGVHLSQPIETFKEDGSFHGKTRILINPPGDYQLDVDDEIIVIAEDNDSFSIGNLNMVDPRDVPNFEEPAKKPMKMMLTGFRRDLDDMINEIVKWVEKGSTLVSLAPMDPEERMQILIDGGLEVPSAPDFNLVNLKGDPALFKRLESLKDDGYPLESFDAIIILTEQNEGQVALNCDSRTLVTTLLIRDIQKRAEIERGIKPGTVVAEILDPRTERLLKMAKLDDFISSNDLVSMALGQVAEESDIHGLLFDPTALFDGDVGNEMHIKDIRLYAHEGETLNWWEIVARARMRGEVAMGFIKPELSKNPVLNPGNGSQKDIFPGDKHTRLVWKYGDQLVVFSED